MTTLVGTAFRISGTEFGSGDTITAGSLVERVDLQIDTIGQNNIGVSSAFSFRLGGGTVVSGEAEVATFSVNGAQIATQSPTYEMVVLNTDAGAFFGITFAVDGDTYFLPRVGSFQSFLPRPDFETPNITSVTANSTINQNEIVHFNTFDFGMVPADAAIWQGEIAGGGLSRVIYDSDDILGNSDGGTEITPFSGEVLVSVTFAGGTTLAGVNGFQIGGFAQFGQDQRSYFVEEAAIQAAGFTLDDIVDVDFQAFTDHDLTYSDVGFELISAAPGGALPEPTPEPEPVPSLNLVQGTDGNDRLFGTDGDDVLFSGSGARDVLIGGAGADTFVFGRETQNGSRNVDVIRDFDASVDTLFLEAGAQIRAERDVNAGLRIILEGDRDVIVLRDFEGDLADINIVFDDGLFSIA